MTPRQTKGSHCFSARMETDKTTEHCRRRTVLRRSQRSGEERLGCPTKGLSQGGGSINITCGTAIGKSTFGTCLERDSFSALHRIFGA
ncbi:hypothetical protein CEXT_77641 [Caerostris extrusa]|uniref:Uncharacterized protein n=1 Tax=Caerostris extrusa TaxID=172846 RepID=A0AAV4U5P5_CAEEX|nr:hypothetical protein CEXT_77641 [Caerostris extrusa]